MSSISGGFWPGEAPADDDNGEHDLEVTAQEPETESISAPEPEPDPVPAWESRPVSASEPEPAPEPGQEPEPDVAPAWESRPVSESEPEPKSDSDSDSMGWELPEAASAFAAESATLAHRPGEIDVPAGIAVIDGSPRGRGRSVGIVVARFNSEISNGLLESALEALAAAGVEQDRITVMPVPGAFELPIGAMALAKTRRYSCVIGLGCVIRGETSHFDFVATEAASGLQLAGLETGVPVAFGVLTVDTIEQAEERLGKGGEAARAALEMADIFSQVRSQVRAAT